jgi:hypothetical protein
MTHSKAKAVHTLSLDEHELMCRLIEASTGEKRPKGRTPKDLLQHMIDAETREFYSQLTRTAMLYVIERLGAAGGTASGTVH